MRLSIDDIGDPEKGPLVMSCEIYLDDVKQDGVIVADEEAGEIELYIPREDPRWQNEFKMLDYWPTEKKTGKVEIRKVIP